MLMLMPLLMNTTTLYLSLTLTRFSAGGSAGGTFGYTAAMIGWPAGVVRVSPIMAAVVVVMAL